MAPLAIDIIAAAIDQADHRATPIEERVVDVARRGPFAIEQPAATAYILINAGGPEVIKERVVSRWSLVS